MNRRLLVQITFCLMIIGMIAFTFFTFSLKKEKSLISQTDFDSTVRIQNHIPNRYDDLLSLYSLLGSFEVLVVVLTTIIILRKSLFAFMGLAAFTFGHIVEIIGKFIVTHPGPPFFFHRTHLPFHFPSSYVNPGSSYPSGHSFRTVFLSILIIGLVWSTHKISFMNKCLISVSLCAFSIGMLITRVSLGEHWTSDVIGGSFLGLWLGSFSLIFFLLSSKQKSLRK